MTSPAVPTKFLIFIVAYNAERHIESVLRRIPETIWQQPGAHWEILIIDDQSRDQTTPVSQAFKRAHPGLNLVVLSNPINQGYGGNQKLGYAYAIREGFDVVVLLHGDGQYAPELLPEIASQFNEPTVDAVFGSRMMIKGAARRGGMPLYKWVGNRILTSLQNLILDQNLSEFHSGYRAYRVRTLKEIPFEYNSSDFDFDTDIIIQLVAARKKIVEIPIPTYYGSEICHVNGIKYAAQIILSSFRYILQRYSILYHPKFDLVQHNEYYTLKLGQLSSHQWALDECKDAKAILDLGCGPGYLAKEFRARGAFVMGIDRFPPLENTFNWFFRADIESAENGIGGLPRVPDRVLCLDVIEHLKSPEQFLGTLRQDLNAMPEIPDVVISTPNVAFAMIRAGLLFGSFNYGKKGILDLTHTRLFTFRSFRTLLRNTGFRVLKIKGIPPPVKLVFGDNWLGSLLSAVASLLTKLWPQLFAYQIAAVTRPLPNTDRLLRLSREHADRIEAKSLTLTQTRD